MPVGGLARWASLGQLDDFGVDVVARLAIELLASGDPQRMLVGAEVVDGLCFRGLVDGVDSSPGERAHRGRLSGRRSVARAEDLRLIRARLIELLGGACAPGVDPGVSAAAIGPYSMLMGTSLPVELPVALLRHPDARVRARAVVILTSLMTDPGDDEGTARAEFQLPPIDPGLVDLVLLVLDQDTDANVRVEAAGATVQILQALTERADQVQAERVASRVASHLNDSVPAVRAGALELALLHHPNQQILDQLVTELGPGDVDWRFVRLIHFIGPFTFATYAGPLRDHLERLVATNWSSTAAIFDQWPDPDARATMLQDAIDTVSV